MAVTGSVLDAGIGQQLAVANGHLGLLVHIATIGLSLAFAYMVIYVIWWVFSRLVYYI